MGVLASGFNFNFVFDPTNSASENNLGENPDDFVRLALHRFVRLDPQGRLFARGALFSSLFYHNLLPSGQGRMELAMRSILSLIA